VLKKLTLKRIRKAEADSAHLKEFARLAYRAGDTPRIKDQPPLIYHDQDLQRQADFHLSYFRQLTLRKPAAS